MSWSSRRQALFISGVLGFFIIVIGIPAFFIWYEKPTCVDGIQNQGELGVDRGGPCTLLHESQVQNPAILWARSFQIVPGVYSAVAYIDNPNFEAGAIDVSYSFKLFDTENILVAERQGTMHLPPNAIVPVFVGGISTGERVPARTFFEFLEPPQWERVDEPVEGLAVESRELSNEAVSPRIDAVIANDSFSDIFDVEVIATVFNSSDTAIAASRTVIDVLPGQGTESVTFTWPQPFPSAVARIEIIPQAPFRE